MSRSSRTPFVILGLLGLSGRTPRSGYDIKKVIATVISSVWHESDGQLYPALRDLEASGEITAREVTTKGRRKTLYTITPAGRRRLRAWLAAPVELGRPRDELILKLFFASEGELPDLIRHIEEHRRRAEAGLAQCRQWEAEGKRNPRRYRPFLQLAARAGIRLSEANLSWAQETLAALAAMNSAPKPT